MAPARQPPVPGEGLAKAEQCQHRARRREQLYTRYPIAPVTLNCMAARLAPRARMTRRRSSDRDADDSPRGVDERHYETHKTAQSLVQVKKKMIKKLDDAGNKEEAEKKRREMRQEKDRGVAS